MSADEDKKRLPEAVAQDSKRAKTGFRLRRLTLAEQRRTNDEIHSSVKLCPGN